MKPVKRLMYLLLGIAAACPLVGVWWIGGGLARGQDLIARNQYAAARGEIERYLWLWSDDDARLALAEAYAKDSDLPGREGAKLAVAQLQMIDADSPIAGQSQLQEARLRFLILNQFCEAERLLHSILEREPDSFAGNYLMWKILDLTRRYYLVEPYFRKCFLKAEKSQKKDLLYEWYLSQFSTFDSSLQLEEKMGFVRSDETGSAITEHRRLATFAQAEPDCATAQAALADWYREHAIESEKWDRFKKAWDLVDATTPPFVYAVLFDILSEAGRFDEARQVMERWPEPRDGYDYYKRQGIRYSEIDNDPDRAIESCRAAVGFWPGPVDWQLHHRLAGLLTRTGRVDDATEARTEAKRLEELMSVKFHRGLREILFETPSAQGYRKVAQFYDDMGRELEAKGWRELAKDLPN